MNTWAKERSALEEAQCETDELRAEVERLTRERDEARAQAEADWNACCDVLVWARRFPKDSPPPSRAVACLIDLLRATQQDLADERAGRDSIPAAHAEKVLVDVAKQAARIGAEEMRERAVELCRDRAMKAVAKKNEHRIKGDAKAEQAWFYNQTTCEALASAISCIGTPEPKP